MRINNDEKDILFSTFAEITSLISAGKDNRVIFYKILENALDLLPSRKVFLILLENHRIMKYTAEIQDKGRKVTAEDMPESAGIVNWLHREYETKRNPEKVFALDLSLLAAECMEEEDKCGTVISAPLMAKNSLFGIIVAINDPGRKWFTDEDIHLLTIMANQAAIAFENYLLYRKLEKESITDELTGVYNYRFLIRSLKLEMMRASRFGYQFSFLMIDVDNLKEYNDHHGHLSGSRALKDMAAILKSSCRSIDLVSKYGGDEFALILPRTEADGAVKVGDRIRKAVQEYEFDGVNPGLLTCSIGISVYREDALSVEELIDKADHALYTAKSKGKNSIMRYSEMSSVS